MARSRPGRAHVHQRTTPALWHELPAHARALGVCASMRPGLARPRRVRNRRRPERPLREWPGPGPVVPRVHQRTTPALRRELRGQFRARSACASLRSARCAQAAPAIGHDRNGAETMARTRPGRGPRPNVWTRLG
ncbi:MAG: hypothetical protein ABSH34_25380 [Verrucomicrobiota bacterium]